VDENGQILRQPLSKDNYGYFYDPKIAAESASI
jgi:hypothetical protein